ncbi:MAG: hypothetical protein EU551_03195 [Promethearchaeota archaeon]|nr:MAG: hypothetical protein EU551_03195 [Candidatus Lokiarchaeota archaeon]
MKRNIDDLDFTNLLWQSGILSLDAINNPGINKLKDFLETPNNKAKCMALDSNMILYRLIDNFIDQYYSTIDTEFPGIIILPNACQHEFHYKAASSYYKKKDSIMKLIENDTTLGLLLCRITNLDIINDRIERVKDFTGRLGLKGEHEIRKLQEFESCPVIISSPGHLYYSQQIQSERNFVDAIFDSLIRIEIGFFKKNTNADIIFLTGDKDQKTVAETEGMTCFWIKPPNEWNNILKKDKSYFHLNKISELFLELLIFSPFIKVRSGDLEHYYTYTWHDKTPSQDLGGILKAYNEKDGNYYLISE